MNLIEGEKMKISLKRKINALLGTFIIAGTMSGCRVKCDVEKEHRHLYKIVVGIQHMLILKII